MSTAVQPATPRVLCAANQKGGVGKTTTVVNVAAALAERGGRVLVVDLDPQCNATLALGPVRASGTAYEVLVDGADLVGTIKPTDLPGVWCVPSSVDLAGAEVELVNAPSRETRLRTAFASFPELNARFDAVLVDSPPSLGLLTVNALTAAGEVLIPLQCEFYALDGVRQLIRTVGLVREHLNPGLEVSGVLLTMVGSGKPEESGIRDAAESFFGELVLATRVPRSESLNVAPGRAQSVLTFDSESAGALAYRAVANELWPPDSNPVK